MASSDPRTFDLFAPEEDVVYPSDTVTIYRDRASLYHLSRIEDKINRELNPAVVERLEKEASETRERINASALQVSLKGLSTTRLREVYEETPEVERGELTERGFDKAVAARAEAVNAQIISEMIESITDAEGRTAHPGDKTEAWMASLPAESRAAIMECVAALSFSVLEYEAETESADF